MKDKFVSKKYKANVIYVFKKLETMKISKLNIYKYTIEY